MAQISGSNSEKIYSLKRFLGLNENPDGDTKLKLGEAVECQNWKVTRDGNLKRRDGIVNHCVLDHGYPVQGIWSGYVKGTLMMLAACNGHLYRIDDAGTYTDLGSVATTNGVHIFGFDENAYILNGSEYKVYDGTTLSDVVGYIPLVATGIGPDNSGLEGGTLLEEVNKLSAKRKAWLSPDGTNWTFTLPELAVYISSIDKIRLTSDNSELDQGSWSASGNQVTITVTTGIPINEDALEVEWTAVDEYSAQVKAMRFSEIYNGATDTRVFLYGDGSNELVYSGMDYLGHPRADYFPDLYEVAVGEKNTPITGAIRHYSRLIVFKLDSTWTVSQSYITDAEGNSISSYYVVPTNRTIGNVAPGQVQLIMNSPRTLFGNDCYEWHNASAYASNLTADERQAKRISDRIYATLDTFSLPYAKCYDDNDSQEYYIVSGTSALVHNYAADAWYYYTNFDANVMTAHNGALYWGSSDGCIRKFSADARADVEWDGEDWTVTKPIPAYWESGSLDYGADYMRKYSSTLWVVLKPEYKSYCEITAITDRKSGFAVKEIASDSGRLTQFDFSNFDFDNLDFSMKTQPHSYKVRLKAKKFVFHKLIFQSNTADTAATVLAADIRVRQVGYAK